MTQYPKMNDMPNDEETGIAIIHWNLSKANTRWAFNKPVEARLRMPRDKWDQFQSELHAFLCKWDPPQ